MEFWRQTGLVTKIILVIMGILLLLLTILVLTNRGYLPAARALIERINQGEATATPAIEIVPSPTAPSFPPGTAVVTAIGITQVYSGPGEENDKVAILEPGRQAPIIGTNEEETWWAVELPYLQSGRGWVPRERVQAENTLAVKIISAEDPVSVEPAQEYTGKALTNLNVRSGPGLNYTKVGVIEAGQEIALLGIDPLRFWYQVEAPDGPEGKGWVSVDYVQTTDADELPVTGFQPANANPDVPTPPSGSPALTALSVINIRAGPETNFQILGKLQQGQRAEILGVSPDGRWYAIRYTEADSGRAWVSADYVETENADSIEIIK